MIVGVPLSCLFEFQGAVCLIKAKFPLSAKVLIYDKMITDEIKDL
jgi:hypothetical protein